MALKKGRPRSYFEIRNFQKFQHYKHRNPPWIKLYYSILDDPEFLALDEVSQGRLLKLFLVASQQNNMILNEPSYLQKALRLDQQPDLTPLISSSFLLAIREHRASTLQAKCSLRVETETESEIEQSLFGVNGNGNGAAAPKQKIMPPWESFEITDTLREWCEGRHLGNPDEHVEEFQDHFRKTGGRLKNGQPCRDFHAAFRTWMQNVKKFAGPLRKGGIER